MFWLKGKQLEIGVDCNFSSSQTYLFFLFEDVNIENFSITTAIHELAFDDLGPREKINRKNLE